MKTIKINEVEKRLEKKGTIFYRQGDGIIMSAVNPGETTAHIEAMHYSVTSVYAAVALKAAAVLADDERMAEKWEYVHFMGRQFGWT